MGRTQTSLVFLLFLALVGCGKIRDRTFREGARPQVETPSMPGKADEVALWIPAAAPQSGVVIANDKGRSGALFVYDLEGNPLSRTLSLDQPVGVSVRYNVRLSTGTVDVVGCGLRTANQIKLFSIDPDSRSLVDITTEGGIASGFERDTYGFCLYQRASDGMLFAFVSRKGTDNIHQIALEDDGTGKLKGTLVRKFGAQDQKSYVEGMVADDEYGYLYASDERYAVLKYHADPNIKRDPFIRAFGLADGIRGDREGLALYKKSKGTGYLIVSSQGDSTFKIYERGGNNRFVKTAIFHGIRKADGIATSSTPIPPKFPTGIFAAHNDEQNNIALVNWGTFSRLK